ncbi:MAG: indolepyruvate oxidoreductase subunit beta [Promethearchaeota archaeon]
MKYDDPFNIVIAGVGGQGNVLSSRLIANAAIAKGYFVAIGETYGAAQRGGSVMSHIRISKHDVGPLIPQRSAHLLLGFEPIEALRVGAQFLKPSSNAIVNMHPVYPIEVLTGQLEYPLISEVENRLRTLCSQLYTLDAVDLAQQAGDPLAMNTVMVGALAGANLAPVEVDVLEQEITKMRRLKSVNLTAFNLGVDAIKKNL